MEMIYEDAVDDWKSNDDWKFADKEACWKFMFEKGQESLRQQLAAALAACKQKDESLEAAHNGLRWWMDAFPLHVTEADNEEMLKLVKALAIRPGTEALEKWLGEPVAIIGKHGHPKHISAIPSIEENRLYGPFEPLYAKPKERMK